MSITTYDICRFIQRQICNEFATNHFYGEVTDVEKRIKGNAGYYSVDPSQLTKQEMENLMFGKWNDESELMLIPLWLKPFLTHQFPGASIMNEEVVILITSELDNESRMGLLAYGVYPREENNV